MTGDEPQSSKESPDRVEAPFRFKEDHSRRAGMEWIALSLAALGLIYIGFLTFHPWLTLQNSDGALFYILAVALKTGKGYVNLSLPYPEQVFNFTPIWPAMLAGLMTGVGSINPLLAVPAAKWLLLFMFIATLALFNVGTRPHVGSSMALVLTLLLAVNGSVHQYMGDLLADIPYMLFSIVTMALFFKRDAVSSPQQKSEFLIIGLVLLAVTIMIRPTGLALGGAVVLIEAMRKQWKQATIVAVTCVVVFGGWSLMEHSYRSSQEVGDAAMQEFIEEAPVKLAFLKYFSVTKTDDEEQSAKVKDVGQFVRHAIHRSEQYGMMIAKAFWPFKILKEATSEETTGTRQWEQVPNVSKWLFFALTLGFFALGWKALDNRFPLVVYYPAVYMAILFAYPYVSGRYLFPIMPMLMVLFFVGLEWMLGRLQLMSTKAATKTSEVVIQRRAAAITTVVALMSLGVQLQDASSWWARNAHVQAARQGPQTSISYTAFYNSLVFLHALNKEHGQDEPFIVVSRKPEITYYYSGVKSVRFPFYSDKNRLFLWLKAQQEKYEKDFPGGVYILEDRAFKESQGFLAPAIRVHQDQLDRVYDYPGFETTLWKVKTAK